MPPGNTRIKIRPAVLSLFAVTVALLGVRPAPASTRSALSALDTDAHAAQATDPFEVNAWDWWRIHRLPTSGQLPPAARSVRRPASPRSSQVLRDVRFEPTLFPSLDGVPIEQVVVTSVELAEAFEAYAVTETRRGIPTVVRTVEWIAGAYPGVDRQARIRAFLRDAHDRWGAQFVVLGGDVEHVPARYIPWSEDEIPTDLYYACLDREWNEDGDDVFGEPLVNVSVDYVNDVDVAADGRVWFATNAGAAYLENGEFTAFDSNDGLPADRIDAVATSSDGTVWLGTPAGIARGDDAGWTTYSEGALASGVLSLEVDASDRVWAGTRAGLAAFDGSSWAFWTEADGLPHPMITALAHDGEALWLGTLRGAARMTDDEITPFDRAGSGILSDWVLAIDVDDTDGSVWFGHADNYFTAGGFSRFDGSSWHTDDVPALGGLDVRSLVVRDGEIWAATNRGLFHRGPGGDDLFGSQEGMAGSEMLAVTVGPGAEVIAGGVDGVTIGQPGEWTTFTALDGLPDGFEGFDDVDMIPDVALGRIPATDPAEVALYLAKLDAYRRGADNAGRALFLGEVLSPSADAKDLCIRTRSALPATFENVELYESDGTENRSSALAALDDGPSLVVHASHGSYDLMGAGADLELLFNSDLDRIDSGGRFGLHLVFSCNSGGFDQDCSMEHLLFNPNGGSVATVANTRGAVAAIDTEFSHAMLTNLFESRDARPAVAYRETMQRIVEEKPDRFRIASWWRRMMLVRTYLGSPTLGFWRSAPARLSVSHAETVPAMRSALTVHVADEETGAPISGALVCVMKGVEDFAYGRTDEGGEITLDFRPERGGTVSVHVEAADYIPYEGSLEALAATAPNVVADGWRRADASDAESPRRHVTFGVRNTGAGSESGWSLHLVSEEPGVTILGTTGSLAPLGAGKSGWTSAFEIDIDPAIPDGTLLRFELEGEGPSSFRETYFLAANAPVLELAGVEITGDVLRPRVRNAGSVSSGTVTARLTLFSGTAAVLDGNGAAPAIRAGSDVVFDNGFRVSGDPAAVFELELRTAAGPVVRILVDRQRPEPPTALAARPTDRGVLLTWSPSASEDVVAYQVLGRRGGDWVEELVCDAHQGALAHIDLPRGTSRDLRVLAVDTSGQRSEAVSVPGHAAPPPLAGWPQPLSSIVGPSPVIAADLDRDGSSEVLLGSMWEANAVHVFRANGEEWTDGDSNPATNGIFGRANERIHAAPLAVDVDADGMLEIFAASLDGYVYGWRTASTGATPSPLPGWPIEHPAGLRSSPVAADLDGDGRLEIVTAAMDGTVRAFEADGTPVDGWPRVTGKSGFASTPAVADLDRDGREDIVFGGNDGFVYAVSGTGADLPGWPVAAAAPIQSAPVLGDVDGDEDLEIFVITTDGIVVGLDHEGHSLPGWPFEFEPGWGFPPSPGLADFDQDGTPEIVVAGDGAIWVLRPDGTLFVEAIALDASAITSPVIADLDGDGAFEILLGTDDRRLGAYALDGSVLPGWPLTLIEMPKSTPFVSDLDGDGDLDVVVGADDMHVRVLDVAGRATPGAAPWPGYHGGATMRGLFLPQPYDLDQGPDPGPSIDPLRLLAAAPNPFRASTDLRFAIPADSQVSLEVYDVTGRLVASPVRDELYPAGPHAVRWDGRDASGRPVASGVYFLRVRAGSATANGKILRLR